MLVLEKIHMLALEQIHASIGEDSCYTTCCLSLARCIDSLPVDSMAEKDAVCTSIH
jgi:hypothetical protein